jgi:uridine kinase
MIGDTINLNEEYFATAESLYAKLADKFDSFSGQVVAIAGESGSGKTVAAMSLQKIVQDHKIHALVLHIDDYFKLPPMTNHQNRLKSQENVGAHEVDLNWLNSNIADFKNKEKSFEKPTVNYYENTISSDTVFLENIDLLIIEGTYSFLAEGIDYHIFMSRTYKETEGMRLRRNRGTEMQDPYNNVVLEIEHQIIAPLKKMADAIIDFNYAVI